MTDDGLTQIAPHGKVSPVPQPIPVQRTIVVRSYHCVKCGNIWTPRKEGRPHKCPRCKNANWDKPYQRSNKLRRKYE